MVCRKELAGFFSLLLIWTQAVAGASLGKELDVSNVGPILGAKPTATAPTARVNLDRLPGALSDDFVGPEVGRVLKGVGPERTFRGAKEAQIYKRWSRSVVLVVTKLGNLGSGSVINGSGDILTNWHVVRGTSEIGVIFKPAVEGRDPTKADVRRARVVKFDEVADLALIRVDSMPAGISPISLGAMSDVAVGADVHAIGHPTGEAWTYTRGVVSQIRRNAKWQTGPSDDEHQANVVQTQTPINPGNSGGPLLNDAGKLVGVNSFKAEGEGLNFAVAVDEVQRFLSAAGNRLAKRSDSSGARVSATNRACELKELYRGTSQDDTYGIVGIDLDCDGNADAELRMPFDARKPYMLVIDINKDGKPDVIILSEGRDETWNYSLRATKLDGQWDLVCEHADGGLKATRCEPYP
jgi:S1-C subfamily serine protease